MSAGLFELRKDPITGWWVATIVDRDFDRSRFARPALPIDDGDDCQNCRIPKGDGVRLRILKDYAFNVVGTEDERGDLDRGIAQLTVSDARAAGSWRTIAAPPGEHRPLAQVGPLAEELLLVARELGSTGRRADEPPVPRPVRSAAHPTSRRRGARGRGKIRDPRRRMPVVPAGA
jgi:hypothetical protein